MGKIFEQIKKNGPVAVLIMGLILTLITFAGMRRESVKELRTRFDRDSAFRINEILGSIELGSAQLNLLRSFFESSEFVTKKEFSTFAAQFLHDNAVSAIAYGAVKKTAEHGAFENNESLLSGKKYIIPDTPPAIGSKTLFYPIVYLEPAGPFSGFVGKDLYGDREIADAVDRAFSNGMVTASPPVILLKGINEQPGFLLVSPVKNRGYSTYGGFVVAVFTASGLMSESINKTPILNIHTELFESENGNYEQLADWEPRMPDSAAGFMPLFFLYPKDIKCKKVHTVGGRDFMIETYPGRTYLKNNFHIHFIMAIPVGLLLALLLYLYLRELVLRTELAERKAFENSEEFVKKAREMQNFFDVSLNLLCITNMSGIFLRVSGSWGRILGYDVTQLEGARYMDFVHPDDMEATLKAIKELEKGIEVTGFVNRYRCRDGAYRSIEWRSVSEKGMIYASAMDITDRIRTEKELKESEEKFRTAFKTSPDAIAINRFSDGKYTMINDGFTNITGYSEEDIIGKTSAEIDALADYTDRKKMLEALSERGSAVNMEFNFRLKDKSIKAGLMSAKVITLGGEKHIMANVRDISERKVFEEKLRRQAELLRESQEAGRIGAYSMDIKSDYFTTTEVLEDILGIDSKYPHTMKGWKKLIHPSHRTPIDTMLAGLSANKNEFERTYLIQKADTGEQRWVYGRGKVVFDSENKPEKLVGTLQDVTEAEQARRALAESRELYSNLVETAHELVWKTDTQGRYVYINRAVESILGYKPEEMIGKRLADFQDAEDVKKYHKQVKAEMDKYGCIYGFEVVQKHKNGKDVVLSYNISTITDESGRPIAAQGMAQDVTEKSETEEKIRSLFFGMAEGVALHDYILGPGGIPVDYRIVDVNPQYEKIVGMTKKAVTGKTSREAYGTQEPAYLDEYIKSFKTGDFHIFETCFEPPDKYFSISVSPWGRNGFAAIFTDISARKKHDSEREKLIKELEEKNAEMERFVYTVSHDLKNPLLTISGFSGLLGEHAESGNKQEIKNDLHFILNAAASMKKMLEDVLEISRIGRVVNVAEKVMFIDVIKDALEILAGDIKMSGADVSVTGAASEKSAENLLFVDRHRYAEAIQNLVHNAIKFSRPGVKPVVEIGVKKRYNDYIRVYYVKDNGIGIDSRYWKKIFELFERLDQSVEGTGIGLPVVKRIVELHGGRIWVESEGPDKGSVFYFTIGGDEKNDRERTA
ncbi:MAG: PAS domain S-box protein [Spirochaetia bacterium]|nr:PAS domain S-box protein [Spirochaetia bacterium]